MNAVIRWSVVLPALALAASPAIASTRVAIYAIVDAVELEPSSIDPDQIWISGVFVVPQPISSGLHQPPARGHLYFRLNQADAAAMRAEWEALRAAAGTGRVVGFGEYWMPCSRSATDFGAPEAERERINCSFEAVVHATDRTLAAPGPYPKPTDEGVVSVFDHEDDLCPRFGRPSVQIVADLRAAHTPGARDEPPPCPDWIGLLATSDLDTAFRLQSRDAGWADASEALLLQSLADADGLELADLSVRCLDTVCRIHVAFPSADYEETTGNRLVGDALRDLPGFVAAGKRVHARDAPAFDYYIQRRKTVPAAPR